MVEYRGQFYQISFGRLFRMSVRFVNTELHANVQGTHNPLNFLVKAGLHTRL